MVDKQSVLGRDCEIHQEAEIINSQIASEVVIDKDTRVVHSILGKKVRLERYNSILYSKMDKFCYTGSNTTIRNAVLGKFNSIAWNVSIGGNNPDLNHITTHSFLVYEKWGMGAKSNWESDSEKCVIANDVWIGAGAHILRGVKVASGAVIGAGTVVTKDVPPYAIVIGNPGKIMRYRCSEELIEKLLDLEWWNLPEHIIKTYLPLFQSELTEDVIKNLYEIKATLI